MLQPSRQESRCCFPLPARPAPGAAETVTNGLPLPFPLIDRFENFQMQDGMPTHKVHCVLRASDGKLWVGTYDGALVREDGKFRRIGVEDGLSHRMVLCLVEDKRTGDMWIGTMRGLNRYSAGRITTLPANQQRPAQQRRLWPGHRGRHALGGDRRRSGGVES